MIVDEFDCLDCLIRAEEAAEAAMLGWSGIVDYYREFRESCPDRLDVVIGTPQ